MADAPLAASDAERARASVELAEVERPSDAAETERPPEKINATGAEEEQEEMKRIPPAILRVLNIMPLVHFWVGKVSLLALLVSATALLFGSALNVSVQIFLIMEDAYVRDRRVTDEHLALGIVFCGCLALYAWGYLIWVFLSLQLERMVTVWVLLEQGGARADDKNRPWWRTLARFVAGPLALIIILAVWATFESYSDQGLSAATTTWYLGATLLAGTIIVVAPDFHPTESTANMLPPAKLWYLVLVLVFLISPALIAGLVFANDGFPEDWRTNTLTSYLVVTLTMATFINGGILLYELVATPLLLLWERVVKGRHWAFRAVAGVVAVASPLLGGLLILAGACVFMREADGVTDNVKVVDNLIIAGEIFLLPAPVFSLCCLLYFFVLDDIELDQYNKTNAPVSIVYFIICVFVLLIPGLLLASSSAQVTCIIFAFIFLGIWTTCMARPDDDLRDFWKASWWKCPGRRITKTCLARAYGFGVLILVPLGIVVLPLIFLPGLCRVHLGTLFFLCVSLNGFAIFGFDRYSDYRMEDALSEDVTGLKNVIPNIKEVVNAMNHHEDTATGSGEEGTATGSGEEKGAGLGWGKPGYETMDDEGRAKASTVAEAEGPQAALAAAVPTRSTRQRGLIPLLVVAFMHAAIFALAMLSSSDELVDDANPRVLVPVNLADRTPAKGLGYAICPQRYFGLDPVDLAYLISVSYFYEPGSGDLCLNKEDMQEICIDRYFHANYTGGLGVPFDFEVLDVEAPEGRSAQSAALFSAVSPAAKVVVVAVRGSVTVRDFLEDFNLYSEIATLQLFSFILPFIYVWPVEVTAFFVKFMSFGERLSFVGRQGDSLPVSNYYAHVEDYIKDDIRGNPAYDDYDILVIGHSLGAATAVIVGARNHIQSFAIEPPGFLFNHEKFGIDDVSSIYETATALVRHNDPVTFADRIVGNVQTINCDAGFLSAYCHLMRPLMCHLMYFCGTLDRSAFDYWGGGVPFCSDEEEGLM